MTEIETKRRAKLNVQLVGYTQYQPPTTADGSPLSELAGNGPEDVSLEGAQRLIQHAGQGCYLSFDNKSGRTTSEYIKNLLKQKHHSVLEHVSVSFWITGISRGCSHEIVRHRHHSFSQLSQRYVPAEKMGIVVPPVILDWFSELIENAEKSDEEISEFLGGVKVSGATNEQILDHCAEMYAKDMYDRVNEEYTGVMEELAEIFPHMGKKAMRGAARSELTEAVETRMTITGNLRSWMDFIVQRDAPSADAEIRQLAQEIGRQLAMYYPAIFGPEGRALWDDASRHEVDHTPAAPPEV